MPKTEVILYAEDDGSCPLLIWMDTLPPKAQDKCIVRCVFRPIPATHSD